MITTNCAIGTISPYVPAAAMPWDRSRANHLYKRMNFGATQPEIDAALQKNPTQLVDEIIDTAIALPLPPEPEWAFWKLSDYTDVELAVEQYQGWKRLWLDDMIKHGFREKLALFWHNHFVTRADDYKCPSYLYQYHKLLQQHCLGNFKDFVYDIGKTPAMLIFLNGVQNTRFEPNENYARELYELFTLGRDNGYTQEDIAQTAKALTGFNGFTEACDAIGFVDAFHDPSDNKMIFGREGKWGYDDLINILFEERADEIATYICTKLYRHFVSYQVDEGIVAELASTFKTNEFEIAPVLRQLFKSEHFFDEANINVQIKSPIEVFVGFIKESNFYYDDEVLTAIDYFAGLLGQQLFDPTDVAGWDGDRDWIQNVTLTGRWQFMEFYIFYLYENQPQELINLAKTLTNDSNDPVMITQILVEHFVPAGFQSQGEYDRAVTVFKWEVPENYYESGDWNLNWEYVEAQVALLMRHITRQPDYQLT